MLSIACRPAYTENGRDAVLGTSTERIMIGRSVDDELASFEVPLKVQDGRAMGRMHLVCWW